MKPLRSCSTFFFLPVILAGMLLCPVQFACGETLEEQMQAQSERMNEQQQKLQSLTEKERKLHKNLVELEKAVKDAERALEPLEKELLTLKNDQADFDKRLTALLQEREKAAKRLGHVLESLWPIFLAARQQGLSSAQEWAQANRKEEWLAAIYQEIQRLQQDVERQSQQVADQQSAVEEASQKVADKLVKVKESRAALQAKQEQFERQVKDVRIQKSEGEAQLRSLMGNIAKLKHQIQLQAQKQFSKQVGKLPWPAKGKIVTPFNPDGVKESNGIGLQLASGTPVNCLSWGKVVHVGQVRGFGQVVIVFHGEDYYSLYAFLSDASVPVGRDVMQGEKLGVSGFYPKANGNGLYFELRFHQKAINPLKWLQSG